MGWDLEFVPTVSSHLLPPALALCAVPLLLQAGEGDVLPALATAAAPGFPETPLQPEPHTNPKNPSSVSSPLTGLHGAKLDGGLSNLV